MNNFFEKLRDKGISLAEILVAVAILALVITGVLSTAITCLISNKRNNHLVKAANDAQYVLEQIKGLPYSAIASYTVPAFTNLRNESVAITRGVGTYIADITVTVQWKEGDCEQPQCYRSYQVATRVAK